MASYNLSAFAGAGAQFFDNSGVPLAGGLLYVYTAGTTTPATTYTTQAGTIANTNPIVLNAGGRTPNEVWVIGGVLYKFVLKNSAGVTVGTYDNIPAIDDPTLFNNLITVTGTNTLIGTSTPANTSYVTGMTLSFVVPNNNTGAVTIDVDSLGAKEITYGTTALVSGQLVAGAIAFMEYDGTRFQLLSVSGSLNANSVNITNLTVTNLTTTNLTTSSLNGSQLAGFRNHMINGSMNVAQRGTSFAGITNASSGSYYLDRFRYNAPLTSAVVTISQQSDVPANSSFQKSLRLAVTTAQSSITSSDYAYINQTIEGYNVYDLYYNTFTLSFWVRSSVTGTHCVSFGNGNDRSYPAQYTINAANTWEYKTITVTGGLLAAGGTWLGGAAAGLTVNWMLMAGSIYQGTVNTWGSSSALATSSQVNCFGTVGNIFSITGVQLEIGSIATPFEQRLYSTELALCQRYYRQGSPSPAFGEGSLAGYLAASGQYLAQTVNFPVPMRSIPSASFAGTWLQTNVSTYGISTSQNGYVLTLYATAAGMVSQTNNNSGYLIFNSEL